MSDNKDSLVATMQQAQDMIEVLIKAKLVPMIHGSPAIGKSAIVRALAKKHNLKLIDLRLSQCDPTDLLGFPQILAAINRAGYTPMETFPIEDDALPQWEDGQNTYNGWILFLDEFNSANREVQAAAYKIVLDRMVGKYNLHDKVAVVAAGNLASDGAIVEEMSTALQSRLVHIEVKVNPIEWSKWASKEQIDHRIISFIEFKPGLLYTFKPDHTDMTYASPRTWEFGDRILKQVDVKDALTKPLLAGCLTFGVAHEFTMFCDIMASLPTINDIIAAPDQVRVPGEPGHLFAMCGSISHHMNKINANEVMKFVARLPVEFQVVCMRMTMNRNQSLVAEPSLVKWVAANAVALF